MPHHLAATTECTSIEPTRAMLNGWTGNCEFEMPVAVRSTDSARRCTAPYADSQLCVAFRMREIQALLDDRLADGCLPEIGVGFNLAPVMVDEFRQLAFRTCIGLVVHHDPAVRLPETPGR